MARRHGSTAIAVASRRWPTITTTTALPSGWPRHREPATAWLRPVQSRYFVPPYVGHRGWIGVYLDVEVDWETIAELISNAYHSVADPGR